MFFDFTKEISLQGKTLRIYRWLRGMLFVTFLLLAIYLAILVLFPSRHFSFDFTNPTSSSNSIVGPRDMQDVPKTDGMASKENPLVFDTMINESFPDALVNFSLNEDLTSPLSGNISIQKTYRALFYPTGTPIGFKDGTLVKTGFDHFIISNGSLRKFSTLALKNLGFSENQFIQVDANDLKYNPVGDFIAPNDGYPNDSLFKISDNFYMFENGKLRPFTSLAAFNSQYDSSLAIEKNDDFLNQYPLDENPIGFSDGSLISYADSVFIVSEGNVYPIDNPQTFIADGFDWNDVIPANADEIGLYTRTKLFNKTSTNPAGAIFSAVESPLWYVIKDEKKLPIPSEKILNSWLRKKPILFSTSDTAQCQIKKIGYFFQNNSYSCQLKLRDTRALYGNEFRFTLQPDSEIQLSQIDITYSKAINTSNLRSSLAGLYNKITSNYYAPIK